MTNHFETLDVIALHLVVGGQQTQAPKPPAPPETTQPRPPDESKWIRNAAKCARVGGPILGAVCGVLTPSPAY